MPYEQMAQIVGRNSYIVRNCLQAKILLVVGGQVIQRCFHLIGQRGFMFNSADRFPAKRRKLRSGIRSRTDPNQNIFV